MTLTYHLSYLETILVHPTRRQSFAGKLHSTFRNIWAFVVFRPNDAVQKYTLSENEAIPNCSQGHNSI